MRKYHGASLTPFNAHAARYDFRIPAGVLLAKDYKVKMFHTRMG
jgi:hypothetical protein